MLRPSLLLFTLALCACSSTTGTGDGGPDADPNDPCATFVAPDAGVLPADSGAEPADSAAPQDAAESDAAASGDASGDDASMADASSMDSGAMDAGAESDASAVAPPDSGTTVSGQGACAVCFDLSEGAIDRRVQSAPGTEFAAMVAAAAPGGPPIVLRGALWGVSAPALMRGAVAADNVLAVRELADRTERQLSTFSATFAVRAPLAMGQPDSQLAEVINTLDALGEACSGTLSLRGYASDPSLFARLQASSPQLPTVVSQASATLSDFSATYYTTPHYLVIAGRFMASCGTLVGDSNAALAGLGAIDFALQQQVMDGSFVNGMGLYDTGAQARILVAMSDAMRSVPLSACARRTGALQRGMQWMRSRVTDLGVVDSTASARTCQAVNGTVSDTLSLHVVYRSLVLGSVLFESGASDSPMLAAAGRMSAYAMANQGGSTCFP